MDRLEEIQQRVLWNDFEFSQHATDQAVLRDISVAELREAVANAHIIEIYPDDKYGPSCLLMGYTIAGRPLHIQCTYPGEARLKIVTLYQPDPERWIGFRERRRAE